MFGGSGACTDSVTHDGHVTLLPHDSSTGKSTAYGCDCDEVSVCSNCVSGESTADGADIMTLSPCVSSEEFDT